jgi:hypothetical protein
VPGGPAREPRRKRDEHAEVMLARGDMLTAKLGEVADILSEQDVSPVDCSGEHVGI